MNQIMSTIQNIRRTAITVIPVSGGTIGTRWRMTKPVGNFVQNAGKKLIERLRRHCPHNETEWRMKDFGMSKVKFCKQCGKWLEVI